MKTLVKLIKTLERTEKNLIESINRYEGDVDAYQIANEYLANVQRNIMTAKECLRVKQKLAA